VERIVSAAIDGGFFGVDVAEVRSQILDEPWIFDASVRRVWPDTIRVSIHEQHAVALWGAYALLNEFADIFVPDTNVVPAGLVLLDGPIGSEAEVLERYGRIQQKLGEVGLRVASVKLSERRAWAVGIDRGATLMFGRHAVDDRLERFNRAFERILKANWDHLATVDLRYTNGFAIREKAPSQDNG
jgi:cell division protein FtsQ